MLACALALGAGTADSKVRSSLLGIRFGEHSSSGGVEILPAAFERLMHRAASHLSYLPNPKWPGDNPMTGTTVTT